MPYGVYWHSGTMPFCNVEVTYKRACDNTLNSSKVLHLHEDKCLQSWNFQSYSCAIKIKYMGKLVHFQLQHTASYLYQKSTVRDRLAKWNTAHTTASRYILSWTRQITKRITYRPYLRNGVLLHTNKYFEALRDHTVAGFKKVRSEFESYCIQLLCAPAGRITKWLSNPRLQTINYYKLEK